MKDLYWNIYWFAYRWKYTIGAVAFVLFLGWLILHG